jgi:hypothetical protein
MLQTLPIPLEYRVGAGIGLGTYLSTRDWRKGCFSEGGRTHTHAVVEDRLRFDDAANE